MCELLADTNAWAWSVFWQANHLQACVPSDAQHGIDDIEYCWQHFVATLPDGARVLDLGTGNGALALLAQRAADAAGRRIELHGVDAASIEPARFVVDAPPGLRNIQFHSGVAMESLPFDDQRFDAVIGQFALEYSDTARSVPELVRVLRPGGPVRFLLHSTEAALKARNTLQREQAEVLLDSPLFARLRALLPAIFAAQAAEHHPGPAAQQTLHTARQHISDFSAVLQALEQQFAHTADRKLVDDLLQAVKAVPGLRLQFPLAELLQRAAAIEAMLRAQILRLRNMENAALSPARRLALRDQFAAAGAHELTLAEARSRHRLVGCWLTGRRRAGTA